MNPTCQAKMPSMQIKNCYNLWLKVDLIQKKVEAIVSDTHKQGMRINKQENKISLMEQSCKLK
jgi:hypothetical protein